MDNNELKEALFNQRPVVLNMASLGELHYKRVSAIIYRVKNGKLNVRAEIEDKCGHSVTICNPKDIKYEEK